MKRAELFVPAVAGLTMLAACSSPDTTPPPNPWAVPSTSSTHHDPTPPSHTSHTAQPRGSELPPLPTDVRHAVLVAPGVVKGQMAHYSFPGVTPEKVDDIEHCGNRTDKILLTFDDTGTTTNIRKIVQILHDKHVGAFFFPNSGRVSQSMFDELRAGHFYVGNHTADHPKLTKLSGQAISAAIKSGGHANVFRPPYGGTSRNAKTHTVEFDSDIQIAATALGKRLCTWTFDTEDYTGLSAQVLIKNFIDGVRPGDVVLAHMLPDSNIAAALPAIIDTERQMGREFCAPSSVATTITIPEDLHC